MYTTRYGRVVKKPVTYEPEQVEFDDDDSGSDVSSDVSSEISYESEELTSESDADDTGNLKDFVVESDAEDDEKNSIPNEQNGSDDQSSSETDEP